MDRLLPGNRLGEVDHLVDDVDDDVGGRNDTIDGRSESTLLDAVKTLDGSDGYDVPALQPIVLTSRDGTHFAYGIGAGCDRRPAFPIKVVTDGDRAPPDPE